MQREAELAESTSNAAAGSKAWQLEQARLQEAADKWRGQAVTLQAEVQALLAITVLFQCLRSFACRLGICSGCRVLCTLDYACSLQ